MAQPRDRTTPRPKIITRHAPDASSHGDDTTPIMRRGSTHRYQTFPTQPPKTPIDRPSSSETNSINSLPSSPTSSEELDPETPLPLRQLLLLAYLSLCEQTALNSISPYLPEMVASMPGIPHGKAGIYVGILASAFALAQLSTNFLWGYTSDLVGRKPVLLAGTFFLMCCFCLFGLCTQYWQMVLVHVFMGLLNGNAACVPTVLGEVTDRSNQSRAFTYLPIIYSIGGITGPALGGMLVRKILPDQFPYFAPNIVGAAVLASGVFVVLWWFEETLDQDDPGPTKPAWLRKTMSWLNIGDATTSRRHSWSTRWPRRNSIGSSQALISSSSSDSSADGDETTVAATPDEQTKSDVVGAPSWRMLLNHTTILLLATYLIFQLSNVSFNSLYPIFASSAPPTGRGMKPDIIGLSLSIAGLATIIFQAFFFRPIKLQVGNVGTYRVALLGLSLSMIAMPWIGQLDDAPLFGIGSGKTWLYVELSTILIIKSVCAVGGLSSVMLLITNSAPSHSSLGTLNGIAQTLSALGRSIGPFISGGLFTLSTGIRPRGELLAWTLFGGLALLGWFGSLFIRADSLESDDWQAEHGREHHTDDEV